MREPSGPARKPFEEPRRPWHSDVSVRQRWLQQTESVPYASAKTATGAEMYRDLRISVFSRNIPNGENIFTIAGGDCVEETSATCGDGSLRRQNAPRCGGLSVPCRLNSSDPRREWSIRIGPAF
jgi:hypothetical protein